MNLVHSLGCNGHHLFSKEINVITWGQVGAINGTMHKSIVVHCAHLLIEDCVVNVAESLLLVQIKNDVAININEVVCF